MLEDCEDVQPPIDVISEFNTKAQEAVDTFNKYLENVPNAVEADKINKEIESLNDKIKEYTELYDKSAVQNEEE